MRKEHSHAGDRHPGATSTHYRVPGYLDEPPDTYQGLEGRPGSWGTKQGLTDRAISCDFVSRWGLPGQEGTFSVVGPITLARVPG